LGGIIIKKIESSRLLKANQKTVVILCRKKI